MKRLIMAIGLCLLVSPLFAQSWDTSIAGSIYNVTVTSITSATLYTLANESTMRSVSIDNRTGYTIYLSTFTITPTLGKRTTDYLSAYPIPSSTDITKPLPKFNSSAFKCVISSADVPSTNGLYVIIEK